MKNDNLPNNKVNNRYTITQRSYRSNKSIITKEDRKKKAIEKITKQLENNEYLLKLELKKQQEMQKNFDKQLTKISESKLKLEKELDDTLKELNEKEAQIYNIQKDSVEKFKVEIKKYDAIHAQLVTRIQEISESISNMDIIEEKMINNSNMLNEDRISYANEISLYKDKINDTLNNLKQLELSYPKEFNFLKEDFQLNRELSSLMSQCNNNNNKIKHNTKIINENNKNKQALIEQLKGVEEEWKENCERAKEENKTNESISKLEEHIVKNIEEIYLWNYIKGIMIDYYNEIVFDGGNGDYLINLNAIWSKKLNDLKLDFYNHQKSFQSQIDIVTKRINDLDQNNKIEINIAQEHLNKIVFDKENFENCYGKVFELYNSFITLIKKKEQNNNFTITEAKDENLEELFVSNVILININMSNLSEEDKKSFIKLLKVFLNELSARTKTTKILQVKDEKISTKMNLLKSKIDIIHKNNDAYENENKLYKDQNMILGKKIQNIKDTLIVRNKTLKSKFEKISQEQFTSYLQANQITLKNMGKIYGNKMVNKVNKVQKEKLYENIIQSHTEKKGKINKYITFISKFEETNSILQNEIKNITVQYDKLIDEIEQLAAERLKKMKEKELIEESEQELKNKIDTILIEQEKNIKEEKDKLRARYNVDFFLEKIKDINNKLTIIEDDKQRILSEIELFNNELSQKEKQIHLEDLNLKNNLVVLKLGIPEEHQNSAITVLPFRHSEVKIKETVDSNSIRNKVKSSLNQFNYNVDTKEEENKIAEFNDKIKVGNLAKEFLIYEKVKPLLEGIILYKKYNNTSSFGKSEEFDPFMVNDDYTPEKCGYGLRMFMINQNNESIDVFPVSSGGEVSYKKPEKEIKIKDIVKIMNTFRGIQLIKEKERNLTNKNSEDLTNRIDNIPFTVILSEKKIDLIAITYSSYIEFSESIKELMKYKNKMNIMFSTINKILK